MQQFCSQKQRIWPPQQIQTLGVAIRLWIMMLLEEGQSYFPCLRMLAWSRPWAFNQRVSPLAPNLGHWDEYDESIQIKRPRVAGSWICFSGPLSPKPLTKTVFPQFTSGNVWKLRHGWKSSNIVKIVFRTGSWENASSNRSLERKDNGKKTKIKSTFPVAGLMMLKSQQQHPLRLLLQGLHIATIL